MQRLVLTTLVSDTLALVSRIVEIIRKVGQFLVNLFMELVVFEIQDIMTLVLYHMFDFNIVVHVSIFN